MSLLHALIARGTTVLAEHDATGSSRYSTGPSASLSLFRRLTDSPLSAVTQTLLSKIPPNDSKLTYAGISPHSSTRGVTLALQLILSL